MSGKIAILPQEARIVRAILRRHLPAGFRPFVFGSRADGKAKPLSDLDLSLEGPAPLGLAILAQLADAFDESPLPWKVDLVDRALASEAFGNLIDAHKLTFELD